MADAPKKSDLKVRTLSAIVMLAVAGFALWQGGWAFVLLVGAVGLGVLWEYWGLVRLLAGGAASRFRWMAFGLLYVGGAMWALLDLGTIRVLAPMLAVIGTDIGAYFAGRAIGGPKIAPAISPSKTWAGLGGGILGAGLLLAFLVDTGWSGAHIGPAAVFCLGLVLAIVAQSGDFFESWMKRRAGVKDSGHLIPGHGGLFDRVDGLIPAAIVFNIWVKLLTW